MPRWVRAKKRLTKRTAGSTKLGTPELEWLVSCTREEEEQSLLTERMLLVTSRGGVVTKVRLARKLWTNTERSLFSVTIIEGKYATVDGPKIRGNFFQRKWAERRARRRFQEETQQKKESA